jgi:hypothetical protein
MSSITYIDPTLPNDEELELITRYLGGALTQEEEDAFDDRMMRDDAFLEKALPIMKVWYAPPPSVIAAGEALKARLVVQRQRREHRRRIAWAAAIIAVPIAAAILVMLRWQSVPTVVPQLRPPRVAETPKNHDTTPPRPTVIKRRPAEVIAALPPAPSAADSGLGTGMLPRPYAARERVRIEAEVPLVVAEQWAPSIGLQRASPNLSFLQKLQHGLGALWGRIKHPRGVEQRRRHP